MNKKIIIAMLSLSPLLATAQIGNVLQRAKNKATQRVDNRIDKEIDKTLDEIEGKEPAGKPANTSGNTGNTSKETSKEASKETTDTEPVETVKGYSKFDFVPGERIIYAEDFQQDAIGELPLTWNSSGKGEVMTLSNQPGKWVRLFQNNTYLTGNRKSFGENYTIEFDLMYFFEPKVKGYVLPGWEVGLFNSNGMDPADNKFLRQHSETNNTEASFGFGSYAYASLESRFRNQQTFVSDNMQLGEPTKNFNKIVHYSMQVQKSRLRLWINETKVFDVPRAINTGDTLNQLFFKMESSNYKDDEIGLFLSNIKIATGLPDTRHKLMDEGKFSTTGILFDVNAATIKPESNGVLKEIAEVLKNNTGVKIQIIGHTDSDGTDAANLELSKKRAEAVKAALVKNWSIDAATIQTDGKGESKPVSDNKTREGKAQNRRVEFVKL